MPSGARFWFSSALIFLMLSIPLIVHSAPAGSAAAPAAQQTGPLMWGVQLPVGAAKMQIYRSTVSYRVNMEAEETVKKLLAVLGSPGIKVYQSAVGSTVMVFIESDTPREWSIIQVSGVKGKAQSFVTISKRTGDVGWKWKRNGKNWDFQ